MVRKFFVVLLIFCSFCLPVLAENQPSLSTLVSVQNVPFEQCTKIFKINNENLFFLTIASINANRFSITEIQSKKGYILFNAVGREFLANVVKIDSSNSILRITPVNNIYYFQPGIVLNIFRYIELNSALTPVNLTIK